MAGIATELSTQGSVAIIKKHLRPLQSVKLKHPIALTLSDTIADVVADRGIFNTTISWTSRNGYDHTRTVVKTRFRNRLTVVDVTTGRNRKTREAEYMLEKSEGLEQNDLHAYRTRRVVSALAAIAGVI